MLSMVMGFMFEIPGYQTVTKIYESLRTVVYRGVRRADLSHVILKVSRVEFPPLAEITCYRREYEVTQGVVLAQSVCPIDLVKSNNRLVLVYKDDFGEALKAILQTTRLSLPDKLEIALKLSAAVGEVHAHQIIHKDISPCNVLINRTDGVVKLIDFGFATKLLRETPSVSTPGVMQGTLRYISPEQTGRMNRAVDYRSDFYALGAVLYELFTGRPPFLGDDPLALVHCHLAVAPKPMQQIDPSLSPTLSQIVLKLMAKTAEDRYQSAWGIQADLHTCLHDLQTYGQVHPFVIAAEDLPSHFSIPQKLYGREQHVDALLRAFDRVVAGARVLMLVSGCPGIGKSALVQEVYKPITKQRGYVISGKYEQFQKNIPYSAVVSAFNTLIQQLLCEDEDGLECWRQRILAALGENAGVITEILPELVRIIGPQPSVDGLEPIETKHRFQSVFVQFVRALCDASHPLVLFLDDLQWIDAATLSLMEYLLRADDVGYLFLIGAYRDNEVDVNHPLMRALQKLNAVEVISLTPLSPEDVNTVLADTLHTEVAAVAELGQLVMRKTQGNPFFVSQFLHILYQKSLLQFQPPQQSQAAPVGPCWRWDINAIEQEQMTDNVVDLLVDKLKNFTLATQQILQLAACVGNRFTLHTLARISHQSETQTYQALLPCLHQELIIPTSDLQMAADTDVNIEQAALVFSRFKFLHDRVQQAAYALIEAADIPVLNLKIGRLLWQDRASTASDPGLFDLIDHLNLGASLVVAATERTALLKLNLEASAKAKNAAAYRASYNYLLAGQAYFPPQAWATHYDLNVVWHLEMAELAYLLGQYDEAEGLLKSLCEHATRAADKVNAYALLITQYTMLGHSTQAITAASRALALLHVDLPTTSLATALLAEVKQFDAQLDGRSIESLVALPNMQDTHIKSIMNILMRVHTAAYFAKQMDLYGWILARMSNLSLQYGLVPESSKGFASFGNHLSSREHQYQRGYELGLLGLRLSEKSKSAALTCKVSVILIAFLSHWVRPLKHSEAFIDEAYNAGFVSGDWQFLGYVLSYGKAVNAFCQGKALSVLSKDIADGIVLSKKIKNTLCTDKLVGVEHIIQQLQAPVELDIEAYLAVCDAHKSYAAMALFLTYHSFVLFLHGDQSAAYASIVEAKKRADFLHGTAAFAELNVLHSLILIQMHPQQTPEQAAHSWQQIEANQAQMHTWAAHSADNFAHKYHLVKAECERLQGHELRALEAYDTAIKAAESAEFMHYAAIANEGAGRLWAARGNQDVALHYLRKAHYYFERWGALHKARLLHTVLAEMDGYADSRFKRSMDSSQMASSSTQSESLDLLSVIKATQAISSEIELDRLTTKMLAIVLENAGAERGFLILQTAQGLVVEAGMLMQQGQPIALQESTPLADCTQLSRTIVNFVAHAKEHVVLRNAMEDNRFTHSDYIQAAQPQSLLCTPMMYQAHLCGILYLENNQATGVFTTHHIKVLHMIASQMAISIENAKLYTQVKTSEQQYRSLYENAIESIFRISDDGIIAANPALVSLLGYPSQAALITAQLGQARPLFADPAEADSLMQTLIKKGAVIGYETQIFQQDGCIIWVLFSARAHFQHDGALDFYEGSLIDITAQRLKAQAERETAIAQLAHQHITSSIQYACRIQRSFLPDQHLLETLLEQSFAISEPRDIVGGDFIFTHLMPDNQLVVAAIDCTGHGVPGAFMTMIAAAGLKWIIRDNGITAPNIIFEKLNRYIKRTLSQIDQHAKSDDGLDGAICTLSADRQQLLFAGARIPLYYVQQTQVHKIDGDRKSIGYVKTPLDYAFTCHQVALQPGRLFVLCSDGIVDQAGGAKGYGFGHKRLQQLLAEHSDKPTQDIGQHVFDAFLCYQGTHKRRDDVTLMGFRL